MPTASARRCPKKQLENCYNCVSYEKRLQLLRIVLEEGVSVYRASKILSINNSTAKVIVRNYKKYNHIFQKKTRKSPKKTLINASAELRESMENSNHMEGQIQKQEQPILAYQQCQWDFASEDGASNFQPLSFVFLYSAPFEWTSWLV